MTFQEVLKQTETFTIEQKQQLGYYMLFSTLTKDKKNNLFHLFHYRNDFEKIEENNKYRRFDKFRGKIKISDDFNEPLEEFNDYMY